MWSLQEAREPWSLVQCKSFTLICLNVAWVLSFKHGQDTVVFLHFLKLQLLSACLPYLSCWHSNWLFAFVRAVFVLFLPLSTKTTAVFFCWCTDGRKCPRKCTTYSSHFAKGHSSVGKVVRENDRELHAAVRNCFLISGPIFRKKD